LIPTDANRKVRRRRLASIELIPVLVTIVGWRWAFAALAPGPAFGVRAIRRL